MKKSRKNLSNSKKLQILLKQEYACANKPDENGKYTVVKDCPCDLWENKKTNGKFRNGITEFDHIIGLAEGGTDDVTNMQALCPNCHRFKTTRYMQNRKKNNKTKSEPTIQISVKEFQKIINNYDRILLSIYDLQKNVNFYENYFRIHCNNIQKKYINEDFILDAVNKENIDEINNISKKYPNIKIIHPRIQK